MLTGANWMARLGGYTTKCLCPNVCVHSWSRDHFLALPFLESAIHSCHLPSHHPKSHLWYECFPRFRLWRSWRSWCHWPAPVHSALRGTSPTERLRAAVTCTTGSKGVSKLVDCWLVPIAPLSPVAWAPGKLGSLRTFLGTCRVGGGSENLLRISSLVFWSPADSGHLSTSLSWASSPLSFFLNPLANQV